MSRDTKTPETRSLRAGVSWLDVGIMLVMQGTLGVARAKLKSAHAPNEDMAEV